MAFRLLGAARTGAVLTVGLLGASIANFSQAADQTRVVITPAPPPPPVEILDREHKLGAGDVIDVTTEKYPEYSRADITLFMDGTFEFPVLDVVSAKGLTTTQLRDVITQGMKKELIRPRVTVELRHIYVPPPKPQEPVIKHTIVALGEVLHAGSVDLPEPQMPLRLVLPLIGWEADADLSAIRISYPQNPSRPEHISDFSKFGITEAKLSPNDDILITGGEQILLMRKPEVRKPDPIHFQVLGAVGNPGPIVAEDNITLAEALKRAGGTLAGAELDAVEIINPAHRDAQGKYVVQTVDEEKYTAGRFELNPVIQNGDVITVPKKAMKVYAYGEVAHKGDVYIRPNSTLMQMYIEVQANPNADERVELIQENKKDPTKPLRKRIDVREIQKQRRPDVLMTEGDVLFVPRKGITRNLMYYLTSITQPAWLAVSAASVR